MAFTTFSKPCPSRPVKRGRKGSVDLETGLKVKKTRMGAESVVYNLSKSKSMSG